jgi:SAM-dependent methyltransferase
MPTNPYSQVFFDHHEAAARASARATAPLVVELVKPRSVVDLGCGTGAWLAEFKTAGIDDFLGIDGDYVDRERLLIPAERFLAHDLKQPLKLDRKFDLAMCLEVAEHLPADRAAALVTSLVDAAPVVLFSAAIPYQRGDDHVNEQWPEYWQGLFADHDYTVVDCLREPLWRHKDMAPWYAQNMLLYINRGRLADYPGLAMHHQRAGDNPRLSIVHPEHYLGAIVDLSRELNEVKAAVLHHALALRSINLIAFPDWRLPREALVPQLRALVRAVVMHPDSPRVALLVHTVDDAGGGLLVEVTRELMCPGGVMISSGPAVTVFKPALNRGQWATLLTLLGRRVVMPNEDAAAIASTDSDSLATITVDAIQNKQPLST